MRLAMCAAGLVAVAGLALLPALAPVAAPAAEIAVTEDAERRITVAERQSMLGQRIAKAACLAALGVAEDAHVEQIGAARALFEASLEGLRHGDPAMGLLPESRHAVQMALGRLGVAWGGYRDAVDRALAEGALGNAALAAIARHELPVLEASEEAVGLIEQAQAGSALPLHLGLAIKIAGRQRMLSQKMAKEACLIASGIDAKANRQALAGTMEMFDLSLGALRNGFADLGIRPPGSEPLVAKLAEVAALWASLRPVYQQVLDGAPADRDQMGLIAEGSDPMLKAMDDAVRLYEGEA